MVHEDQTGLIPNLFHIFRGIGEFRLPKRRNGSDPHHSGQQPGRLARRFVLQFGQTLDIRIGHFLGVDFHKVSHPVLVWHGTSLPYPGMDCNM